MGETLESTKLCACSSLDTKGLPDLQQAGQFLVRREEVALGLLPFATDTLALKQRGQAEFLAKVLVPTDEIGQGLR